jgi:hypothetical protein
MPAVLCCGESPASARGHTVWTAFERRTIAQAGLLLPQQPTGPNDCLCPPLLLLPQAPCPLDHAAQQPKQLQLLHAARTRCSSGPHQHTTPCMQGVQQLQLAGASRSINTVNCAAMWCLHRSRRCYCGCCCLLTHRSVQQSTQLCSLFAPNRKLRRHC